MAICGISGMKSNHCWRSRNHKNVKWIPGHQTHQDEDNGRISKHDRKGNAIADELAGYASQNHNESMATYAQETVRRYDQYRKLVHRIHKHMLRVINRIRGLAQIEQKIASTAETRRKPNIATFTYHKQRNRTTRSIRFLHDTPPVRCNQHQNVCQAMIRYLQRNEIAEEQYARKEDSRFMPVELLLGCESTTGYCIAENLMIYVQDWERRHSPRLTSVMRVMNKMIRDIAANNIHPEDRAIFNTTTTAQCNATKYAIARKQPAFGFIAQLGRDRWRTIAVHIAKRIHVAVVKNFDTETLEPLVVPRKKRVSPDRNGM